MTLLKKGSGVRVVERESGKPRVNSISYDNTQKGWNFSLENAASVLGQQQIPAIIFPVARTWVRIKG